MFLILCSFVFLTSCTILDDQTSNNQGDNKNNNQISDNNNIKDDDTPYNVKYMVEDDIWYETTIKGNEEVSTYEFINFF